MDKYVEKYFAPILGERKAEALECFAKIVQSGHFDGDKEEVVASIICGTMTAEQVKDLKQRKTRVLSYETRQKRYEAKLAQLKAQYGFEDIEE